MATQTVNKPFVISRVFDAPRELMWKVFTDPVHLKQWWGPKGFKVLTATMDLRVGGSYLYGMQPPAGPPMWGKFVFREIVPGQKLVFINSFSDPEGGVTRHPGAENWPLLLLSTFTFEDAPGGKTKFTVNWQTYQASDIEQAMFDSDQARQSMTNGWTGTMDQLETYLAGAKQHK